MDQYGSNVSFALFLSSIARDEGLGIPYDPVKVLRHHLNERAVTTTTTGATATGVVDSEGSADGKRGVGGDRFDMCAVKKAVSLVDVPVSSQPPSSGGGTLPPEAPPVPFPLPHDLDLHGWEDRVGRNSVIRKMIMSLQASYRTYGKDRCDGCSVRIRSALGDVRTGEFGEGKKSVRGMKRELNKAVKEGVPPRFEGRDIEVYTMDRLRLGFGTCATC